MTTERRRAAVLGALLLAGGLLTACGPGEAQDAADTADPAPSVDLTAPPPATADPTAAATDGPGVVLLPDGELRGVDDDAHEEAVRALTAAAGEPDSSEQNVCGDDEFVFLVWGDLTYGHPVDDDADEDAFWTLSGDGEAAPTLPDGLRLAGGLDPAMARGEIIEIFGIDEDDMLEEGGFLLEVDVEDTDDDYRVWTASDTDGAQVTKIGPYEPCS